MNQDTINVHRAVKLWIEDDPSKRSRRDAMLAETWGSGTREWQRGLCIISGKPISNFAELAEYDLFVTISDEMKDIVDEHYRGDFVPREEALLWDELCPAEYAKWIKAKSHPVFATKTAETALRWDINNQPGMLIRGNSGAGKTTLAWAVVRQLEKAGKIKTFAFLNTLELFRKFARAAKDMTQADEVRAEFLVIDDLGKEPCTKNSIASFWELMEYRYSRQLPTLFTTRYARDKLIEQMVANDASIESTQDIVGRILDLVGSNAFLLK